MNLELLQTNMNIIYYKNLIKATGKMKIDNQIFKNKINELEDKQNTISTESEVKTSEVVYSDDYIYKKPWTKLPQVHKVITMKKYVSKLLIDDEKKKKDLIYKLKYLIKNKVLTKKDTVNYDKIKGRIISIPCLSYKSGKYIINI